jgi:hypothetical protein
MSVLGGACFAQTRHSSRVGPSSSTLQRCLSILRPNLDQPPEFSF